MPARCRAFLWIPFVLLFILSSSLSAEPTARDLWFVFVDGELRYGNQHVAVSALEDGNYRYRVDSCLRMDVFGAQPQEIVSYGDYVVTPGLELVSFRSEVRLLSGTITMIGEVRDRVLTLDVESDGKTDRSTIPMKDGPVLADVAIEDWLVSLPADRTTHSTMLFDQDTLTFVECTATRTERTAEGAAWEIRKGDAGRLLELVCDAEGWMREARYDAPELHVVRCTEKEAKEIDYLVQEGRDVLTFPVGREIPSPEQLSSLTVKLSWEDIPFEEFELEDFRQRLVERSESDGRYTAVVKIEQPATIGARNAYPVIDDGFLETLAATGFIEPGHEEIASTARDIVRGKKTSLEAVRALSEWVHGYVEAKFIAESLSGSEVLSRKVGKCTEYSTLFASLARSVGIPTRLALGERLVGDQWMGHMWTEAFVGEWVPVDCTGDEVGGSILLLKFIHSDTFVGTQGLRNKLPATLEIEVLGHELDGRASVEAPRTGVVGRTYTNVEYGCRVTSPIPAWKIEPKVGATDVTVRFRVPGKESVAIHLLAFELPEGVEPKMILQGRLRAFDAGADLDLLRDEGRGVNGHTAWITRFDYPKKEKSGEISSYRMTEVAWRHGAFGCLANINAPEGDHEALLADFEKLLASFRPLQR